MQQAKKIPSSRSEVGSAVCRREFPHCRGCLGSVRTTCHSLVTPAEKQRQKRRLLILKEIWTLFPNAKSSHRRVNPNTAINWFHDTIDLRVHEHQVPVGHY
jgi:hypothetical protein